MSLSPNILTPAPASHSLPNLVDQLVLWLIEHPGEPKKRAAAAFRVSPAWIYQITASDLFKARLQTKLQEVGLAGGLADLQTKLAALMELSVDRLTEEMTTTGDPKFIFEVATRLIASVRGPQVAVQVNNTHNVSFQVDARVAAVAEQRRLMMERATEAVDARPLPSIGDVLGPERE